MSFSRSTTYWQPFYLGSIFWPTMYASLNIVEEEIFLENDDDLQLNAMKSFLIKAKAAAPSMQP